MKSGDVAAKIFAGSPALDLSDKFLRAWGAGHFFCLSSGSFIQLVPALFFQATPAPWGQKHAAPALELFVKFGAILFPHKLLKVKLQEI